MNNLSTMITVRCFRDENTTYYSLLIVVAFFIVCINCGVIVTMATNSILRTKRNAFLASLAVSDFLTGLVAIPLHILCSCYQDSMGNLCLAQAICFRFIAISTMLNIFMITVERYIGIIYPIKYTFILTKTRMFTLLSCTWATSISSAMVSYSWLITSNAGSSRATETAEQWERGYFIFAFVVFFFLPLVVMIVLYARMFITISKARKNVGKSRMYFKKRPMVKNHSSTKLITSEVLEPRDRSRSENTCEDRFLCVHSNNAESSLDKRPRSKSSLSVPDARTARGSFQSTETMIQSCQPFLSQESASHNVSNNQSTKPSFVRRFSDACGTAAARVGLLRHENSVDRLGQAKIIREHRVLIIFVTMLSVFVVCWLSWYIMLFDIAQFIAIPDIVLDCFDILRFSVSFFNPILYTFLKRDFRIAFTKSCGCMKYGRDAQRNRSKGSSKTGQTFL